jgi:hypothetical protein
MGHAAPREWSRPVAPPDTIDAAMSVVVRRHLAGDDGLDVEALEAELDRVIADPQYRKQVTRPLGLPLGPPPRGRRTAALRRHLERTYAGPERQGEPSLLPAGLKLNPPPPQAPRADFDSLTLHH